MSEEEKKAIDKLKTLIQYLKVWKENFTIVPSDVKYLDTIKNLIEKQQKEIEELKVKYQGGYHKGFIDGRISMKYEAQDKIREKIKELEGMSISQDIYYDDIKEMFEELLEEE